MIRRYSRYRKWRWSFRVGFSERGLPRFFTGRAELFRKLRFQIATRNRAAQVVVIGRRDICRIKLPVEGAEQECLMSDRIHLDGQPDSEKTLLALAYSRKAFTQAAGASEEIDDWD